MMKKVLIFAVQFYPEKSGYSFATTNFVKSIQNDFDVTVMTPVEKPSEIEELPNVHVVRGSKTGIKKYLYQFKILPEVVKNLSKWDIIFFDTAEMFILGNIISFLAPNKTILRFHGCMTTEAAYFSKTFMMRVWKFFIRRWVRKTKIITATTPFYIDFIKQYYLHGNLYSAAEKFYEIIPNTVYTNDYVLPDRNELFKEYQIPENQFTMLTLGRMDKDGLVQKGVEDVFFTLKRLSKEYSVFKLIVVGNGDKKQYLVDLSKELNIYDNIIFIEDASHIDVLAMSKYVDATLLYSRFEGMSMFGLESISFGCFPIFSNVGGLKDLVVDNSSGFLVEPQNISLLLKTIKSRIEMNEKDVEKYRENSAQHFQSHFSPEIIAQKFKDATDFIIKKRIS